MDRLLVKPEQSPELVPHVCRVHFDGVYLCTRLLEHLSDVWLFVELLAHERERFQRCTRRYGGGRGSLCGHHGNDGGRVETTGERHPDGNVAAHAKAHRVLEELAKL